MDEKTCTKCGKTKSRSEFYPAYRRKLTHDTHQSQCKQCVRDWNRRHYQNPEHHEARREARYAANIRRRYGLTVAEYRAMKAGGCGICGSHDRVTIDHDHANGKVRAALCANCNRGLGMFADDPERMRRAAVYIEDWQELHSG